ncbi:MAG: hypothetical protein ABI599_03630 [Flavobacteriales bacterium]
MKISHISAYIALATLSLAACRKDKDEPLNNDYTSALDNSIGEALFNDVLSQSDAAAKDNGLRASLDGCVDTVIIDLNAMPHTMLVSFGNTNCVGTDGRSRRGSILVTFTGAYADQGTVITITPQNYYVNDYKVQGTKTVTNMGPDQNGHTYFNVTVAGSITAPDNSWTSTHNANRVRTWLEGEDTGNPYDDVYLITGSGNGVNRNGLAYTLAITQALRIEIGCPYIVSGKLDIVPQGLAVRSVDFGNGGCDDDLSVTVNGNTYYFTGQ